MVYLEILTILVLTLINGVLAMSELALVSSREARLQQMAQSGSGGAKVALALAKDPSRLLSTVQIGITLVGILAGAVGGATLGHRLGAWLDGFEAINPHGYSVGITLTVVAITYLSLIIGELVPKRVALAHPEAVASAVARPMRALASFSAPAVWLLQHSSDAVLRVLGLAGERDNSVSEDEIRSMVAEGTKSGIFHEDERQLIDGVLRLADTPVRVVMTPRAKIVSIDIGASRQEIMDMLSGNKYSRILVCDKNVDRPVGFIHTKVLLKATLNCGEIELSKLLTPLLFVPDRTAVLALLGRFKAEKIHMAVVVDEYGTTKGLVTLTDVVEAVAGDMPESGEEEVPYMVQRADGSWLVDATTPTDLLESVVGVRMEDEVTNVAAFILERLGRIPTVGTVFDYENGRFEIVDMDGNRIDKVLVTLLPASPLKP